MLDFVPTAIRLEPRLYAVSAAPGRSLGITLFDDSSKSPRITLGIDAVASHLVRFDAGGNQLAWGNQDGTVTICNLKEIHDRLNRAGLAW